MAAEVVGDTAVTKVSEEARRNLSGYSYEGIIFVSLYLHEVTLITQPY
jgi:hypothetical protein